MAKLSPSSGDTFSLLSYPSYEQKRRWLSLVISIAIHTIAVGLILFGKARHRLPIPLGTEHSGSSIPMEVMLWPTSDLPPPSVSRIAPKRESDVVKKVEKTETRTESTTRSMQENIGPQLGHFDGVQVEVKERYIHELRVFIERRKVYPTMAKRRREAGRSVVSFDIHVDGSIKNVQIHSESGSTLLDEAALDLVQTTGRFKPFPEGMQGDTLSILLPVDYSLR